MQRSKKIFAAMALTILPAATFAQYPTITKEAQAKIDSMQVHGLPILILLGLWLSL